MVTLTVFISHSFDNQPEFENVTDWLDRLDVQYWRPSEIKTGESLREQLRTAVQTCSVCIFVATQKSVTSSWCGAELGAFWGAGIPIIVYLAEASLPDEALPPILQGDVWERNLRRVAARAEELVDHRDAAAPSPNAKVSSITVEQLETLVGGAVALVAAKVLKDSSLGAFDGGLRSVATEATGRVLRGTEATRQLTDGDWKRRVLWVDDHPEYNEYEREAFESFGLKFMLVLSTEEALQVLDGRRFAAIISDMGRAEGPQEGFRLLESVRARDRSTPFFIYAGTATSAQRQLATARGAQGQTDEANELIDMVTAALVDR
ncbi:TIR domain-containing protein [Lentzea sp. PSKA42]|uniref:TIR domain-containing protein n=1 Tax=Lentzea indica TaxID=2604800 RepID=A0ABX1F9T9_9PSEU|nr:TIR domain-containing protein [Lentzea indica]NKE55602.1 TIR domain-containing protein [Lentzea indica]